MGLDCSHDAWHGSYGAFMRWRIEIARAAGLPPLEFMEGFWEQGSYHDPLTLMHKQCPETVNAIYRALPIKWECLKPSPLYTLLYHSDCDGEIAAKDCGPIADSLQRLLPRLPKEDAGGHIGDWRDKTKQFIRGLRLAAKKKQPLTFG